MAKKKKHFPAINQRKPNVGDRESHRFRLGKWVKNILTWRPQRNNHSSKP